MRLGIDAKWFRVGPPSGRVVVRALVRELLQLDSSHTWVVFVDEAASNDFPFSRPGVEVIPVWAGNNFASNLFVLPSAARRARVDVLLSQNFVAPWGVRRRTGLVYDVIFDSHPQFYTWKERLYFSPLRMLSRTADRLCTISAAERDRMLRLRYGHVGHIDVAPLGVDSGFRPASAHSPAALEELRNRLGLPDRFVLFVGRLNARKNVRGLVRALPLRSGPRLPCVVVGESDWKDDDPRKLASELGLGDEVRFVGGLSLGDLQLVYALATAFCFPSFEEGFGLPALEAMASGVPVVASAIPALREVCGPDAVFCDPTDPASIARALDALAADEGLSAKLRRRGIDRASTFTWRRTAECVLQMMEAAV